MQYRYFTEMKMRKTLRGMKLPGTNNELASAHIIYNVSQRDHYVAIYIIEIKASSNG